MLLPAAANVLLTRVVCGKMFRTCAGVNRKRLRFRAAKRSRGTKVKLLRLRPKRSNPAVVWRPTFWAIPEPKLESAKGDKGAQPTNCEEDRQFTQEGAQVFPGNQIQPR